MSRRQSLRAWWRSRRPLNDAAGVETVRERSDHGVRDRELKGHIARAIETLTPKLRDALLLTRSGEYDYQEVAVMLKVPVGTIKWRVAEARKRIRARLAALGYVDAR